MTDSNAYVITVTENEPQFPFPYVVRVYAPDNEWKASKYTDTISGAKRWGRRMARKHAQYQGSVVVHKEEYTP